MIACSQNYIFKCFPGLESLLPLIKVGGIKRLSNKFLLKLQRGFQGHEIFSNEGNNYQNRDCIARHFIKKGSGIEIGALHHPMQVPKGVKVKYVDRLTLEKLREQYPELNKMQLIKADVIVDGETLEAIESFTQDFVIANHFLEHCQNPILAIENMLRVLKNSGILFLSIPDKRYTFDINRPITTYDHLVKDYTEGPEVSRRQHFEEWVRLANKVTDDTEVERQIKHLMEINYSIHFHVWTETEMIDFFLKQKSAHDFEIELILRNINEIIFVLKK
jgi:predicted SAM-dependent methyltransferase